MFGVKRSKARLAALGSVMALASLLSACSSVSLNRAPVEDRGAVPKSPSAEAVQPVAVKPLPGSENSGKPGYYTVKPKDTLIAIGLETGQSHKDIARWNNLDNPNKIEVGQVLRVIPPSAANTAPATEGVAVSKPVVASVVTPVTAVAVAPVTPAAPGKATAASAPAATNAPPASAPVAAIAAPTASTAASADDDLGWIWPTSGPLLASFDEGKTKGIDLGGAAGDPVVAAADGRVIWAAAGEGTMRHYGNLIIVQHNKTYLTAYANNSTLLVKEDQRIKKGQKIAEMGNSGTDRVKLHFELRRMGIAVDPAKYLPTR